MNKKQILEFSPSEIEAMIKSQYNLKPGEHIDRVEVFNYPAWLRVTVSTTDEKEKEK